MVVGSVTDTDVLKVEKRQKEKKKWVWSVRPTADVCEAISLQSDAEF